jgi:hypothetical protein
MFPDLYQRIHFTSKKPTDCRSSSSRPTCLSTVTTASIYNWFIQFVSFFFLFFQKLFFFLVICKMLWCLTTKKWSWLEEVYDEEESCQESETSCQLCKIITEQKICNHGNTLFLFTSITNLGAFWPLPQLLGVIMHCKKLRADVYLIIVVLVWLTALLSI